MHIFFQAVCKENVITVDQYFSYSKHTKMQMSTVCTQSKNINATF